MRDRDGAGPFRTASRIFFGALVVAAFFLFVLWRTENPRLAQARLALLDWAAPAMETVAGPSNALTGLFDDVRSVSELQAENARLRERVARLETWREIARDLEGENAKLRALAEVALPVRASPVTAEVIGDAGGPFAQSLIVNVGRRDGVEDGAPALDAHGLVGRVTGVGERTSRVLLLSDPASRVPVRIEIDAATPPLRAILIGDGGPTPRLDHVSRRDAMADATQADVAAPLGGRIETSGQGGVFPEGLVIGAVAQGEDGAAHAALAADLERPGFLRVLRSAGPSAGLPAEGGIVLRRAAPTVSDAAGAPVFSTPRPSDTAVEEAAQ